jgi:Calcium-activated chloride channel
MLVAVQKLHLLFSTDDNTRSTINAHTSAAATNTKGHFCCCEPHHTHPFTQTLYALLTISNLLTQTQSQTQMHGTLAQQVVSLRNSWQIGSFVDAVAEYYGSRIGFYFAWVQYCTVTLLFPALFGVFIWWRRHHHHEELLEQSSAHTPAKEVTTAAV